jgi:hypothetical protein
MTVAFNPSQGSYGADVIYISKIVGAVLVIIGALAHSKSPIRKVIVWLWRRNVSGPIKDGARTLLTTTVQPMIAAESEITRAASRAQHDEQNVHISALSDRVGVIEAHITKPRSERERRDDQ